MKKILILLISLTLLTSCSKSETDNIKFKKEYEKLNTVEMIEGENYRNLDISEDNPFIYVTAEDIVSKIEAKETFYVYFGSGKCPWCRSVIETFISVANEENIKENIYYVDIWDENHNEILRDKYELDNKNNPKEVSKGTEAYYKLLDYFNDFLQDYTLSTSKDKIVNVGEKRIFAPSFVYVENGETKDLVTGLSQKQISYNSELTTDIIKDEENIFKEFFNK